jgi:parallel beta-helix repeat protein
MFMGKGFILFIVVLFLSSSYFLLSSENSDTIWTMAELFFDHVLSKENGNNVSHNHKGLVNYYDTIPPSITINFAGNPLDKGGPYWAYLTSPSNGNLEEGVSAGDGYYTNDSCQLEDWMYINVTVIDEAVDHVWLNWLNDTTWTNTTYEFTPASGGYYELWTQTWGIAPAEGHRYSFDVYAVDLAGNSAAVPWEKRGVGTNRVVTTRRYVGLDCSPIDTISYRPYYFCDATYGSAYDRNTADRMHHDQGPNGSATDTGYLISVLPDDTVSLRYCSCFIGYWFDDSVCIPIFTLDSIYYHFWWTSNPGRMHSIGWYDTRKDISPIQTDSYSTDQRENRSVIQYENGVGEVEDTYYLDTHVLDVEDREFTDNSIYELEISMVAGITDFPSVISNRSFISFVLFNVPDEDTLNASYYDSDNDGVSDWTELYRTYTNPFLADTDNDGATDYEEVYAFISSKGLYHPSDPNRHDNTTGYRYVDVGGPYSGLVDEDICFHGTINGGDPPFTWYWDFGDGTGSQLQNASHQFSTAGTYTLTLSIFNNTNECVSDSTTVIIKENVAANTSGPYHGYIGESVQFNGSVTGGFPDYTWLWDFGDGITSTENNPRHRYDFPGMYTVYLTVMDSHGYQCYTSTQVTIDLPLVEAHGPYGMYINTSLRFIGSLCGGTPPYNWSWYFGDGTHSYLQNPNHVYKTPGEYTAKLVVTDNESFSASDSAVVTIGRTLWVDDDFDASTPGWNHNHFKSIQEALNRAGEYDTILVSKGRYPESILLNKKVKITGENRSTTILESLTESTGMNIAASDVIVSNFTLCNFTTSITIEPEASSFYLYNCHLYTNKEDMSYSLTSYGQNGTIEYCTFDGFYGALYLNQSYNIHVRGNTFKNNILGIYLTDSYGTTVSSNDFMSNRIDACFVDSLSLWIGNYWNRPRLFPKPIIGTRNSSLVIDLDWRPSLKVCNG